jgi:hypothetical protein
VIGKTEDHSIPDFLQDLISANFHKIERKRTDDALAGSGTFSGGMVMSLFMSISHDLPHSLFFSPSANFPTWRFQVVVLLIHFSHEPFDCPCPDPIASNSGPIIAFTLSFR